MTTRSLLLVFFLLASACLASNFICTKDIPVYDASGMTIATIKKGTSIDVNTTSDKDLFPVLFTNEKGEMVNGFCKASDLNRKPNAAPPSAPKPAAKASGPETDNSDSDGLWMTSLARAQEMAREKHRLLVMDFTGSDWCGWCIKLDEDTFSKKEFVDYAQENLILLRLDFPKKAPISDELRKQNGALQAQYEIKGFPTIIILDDSGKEVDRLVGYLAGGPKAMIARLQKLKN